MGKMFKLCAALAIVLCASAASFAENLVEIERDGRNIVCVDTDTLRDEGGYVTAVTKIQLRTKEAREQFKEHSGVDAHYLLLSFAYNKAAMQDQLLEAKSVYGYEETGHELRSFSAANWRDIPQDSLGAKVYKWIIEYAASQK